MERKVWRAGTGKDMERRVHSSVERNSLDVLGEETKWNGSKHCTLYSIVERNGTEGWDRVDNGTSV